MRGAWSPMSRSSDVGVVDLLALRLPAVLAPHLLPAVRALQRAIWPGQSLVSLLGPRSLACCGGRQPWRGRAVAAILAACWLWVASGYLSDALCHDQLGGELLRGRVRGGGAASRSGRGVRGRLRSPWRRSVGHCVGVGLYVFALVIQPLIGPFVGRAWRQMESSASRPIRRSWRRSAFVLWAAPRPRRALLPIPLAWCAVSGATAWTMGSPDAWVMPAAGILTFVSALPARGATARSSVPAAK